MMRPTGPQHSRKRNIPLAHMKDRTKGLLIILAGVICVSPDAVLVRYLSTNGARPWTIIFWKLLLSIPITLGYALYVPGGCANCIKV